MVRRKMTLEFEREFNSKIVQRGFDYYKQGKVKKVKIKDDYVGAIVKGTVDYHVAISLQNGKIDDMDCDCPYFYDHDECKHIVAVLYYLNDKMELKKDDIKGILNKINEKELKSFLEIIIKNDENIYDMFRRRFASYFPKVSAREYKRKIMNAIKEAGGRDGFIDYQEGYEYTHKMYGFITEASQLVDNKDYETAFTIIKIILDSIPDTDIDGSNGEVGDVAYSCTEVITKILDEAPKDDKTIKDIFDYVALELETHNLNNYGIELDELILQFIENDIFLNECEKVLLKAIKGCTNDKWYRYHKRYYLEYLETLYDKTSDDVKRLNLIKDNLDVDKTFRKYVDILMDEKDTNEIINKLLKYREKYPQHKKYISDKLLEIYDKTTKEYKNELYNAFFDYDKYNFDKYIQIKSLYSKDEWQNERINIISKIDKDNIGILSKIFVNENMIDDLFELVKDTYMINTYEDYLLPKYRDEVIGKHIETCMKKLKFASNRSVYREIAGNLSHIKKLDIKKKYINDFITYIKKEYSNKPALMDEISHIK